MISTNGTDEGVIRAWLDREIENWLLSFVQTLDEALNQLRDVCFGEAWEIYQREGVPESETARRIIELYERGMVDIFRFVRRSGAIVDDLAWSQFKAGHRRSLQDQQASEAAREALANALYTAEQQAELSDHQRYRSWARCLMLFIFHHAAEGPDYPGQSAEESEKLAWAYEALKDIEDHQTFQLAFTTYLEDSGVRSLIEAVVIYPIDEIIRQSAELSEEPRFDLLLNTALTWLVGAVERY